MSPVGWVGGGGGVGGDLGCHGLALDVAVWILEQLVAAFGAGPEVSHHPAALMAEYRRRLQAEAQGLRDQRKALLGAALGRL